MGKNKENRQGKRWKYSLYNWAMLVMWAALVASIIFRLIAKGSFASYLGCCCKWISTLNERLLVVVKLDSVLNVVKTIGICSTLITWVYSSLDKVELGLKYGELLDELYPRYNMYVLGHFAAILIAIWLCYAKLLESAVIALCIVLLGCCLQWKTLENVVLSSKKRERIAIDRWRNSANDKKKPYEILGVANNIAKQINLSGNTAGDNLIGVFADIVADYVNKIRQPEGGNAGQPEKKGLRRLFEYIGKWRNKIGTLFREKKDGYSDEDTTGLLTGTDTSSVILNLFGVWDKLFSGKKRHERITLVTRILNRRKDRETGDESSICPPEFFVTYVMWLHHNLIGEQLKENEIDKQYERFFTEIISVAEGLRLPGDEKKYIYTAFSVLLWSHFLMRDIGFDSEWLSLDVLDEMTADFGELMSHMTQLELGDAVYQNFYKTVIDILCWFKPQNTDEGESRVDCLEKGQETSETVCDNDGTRYEPAMP